MNPKMHAVETLKRWKSDARVVRLFFVSKHVPIVVSFKGKVAEVHDDLRVKLLSDDGYVATSLSSASALEPSVADLPPDARELMKELLEVMPSPDSEPLLLLFPDETLLLMRAD